MFPLKTVLTKFECKEKKKKKKGKSQETETLRTPIEACQHCERIPKEMLQYTYK